MGKEGFSLKKTIISLFLVMSFILSMSVTVFAGEEIFPHVIVRDAAKQVISE